LTATNLLKVKSFKTISDVVLKRIGLMSLTGFCYGSFGGLGRLFLRIYGSSFEDKLESGDIRIYPEAYCSVIAFLSLISVFVGIGLVLFMEVFLPLLLPFPRDLAFLAFPLLPIGMGYVLPMSKATSRGSSLECEVPFASAYTTVMATGGISPYASLQRLKDVPLLPNLSKISKRLDIEVRGLGLDPVTALEKSAKSLPSKEYKELLLGYASTLRSGGDVVHYMLRRTEMMFRDRLNRIKAIGERAGTLMEIYMTIGVLLSLGLYSIYIVSVVMESFASLPMFSGGSFIMFAYIFLPMTSMLFIWFVDTSQPKYPSADTRVYKVFFSTLPVLIFALMAFFFSFLIPGLDGLPFFAQCSGLIEFISSKLMGLERGYESAVGFCLALIIGTLPAALADTKFSTEERGIEFGITSFLRDLVESRKSGLSPEKCINQLSKRNYGSLTKHLEVIAKQVGWGFSFELIYQTFAKEVRSWLARINMFLLVDAIQVGGGTPETLETLASFSETNVSMEKEKKMMLRPLLIVPYIGAGILVLFTIVFLVFSRSILVVSKQTIDFASFVQLLLPPLVLHVYLMGIVAGKIGSEKISSGFKHALFLTIFTLVCMYITPYVTSGFTIQLAT